MPIDKSIDYSAITPEIKALTKLCLADNVIEPEMYVKYAVNRGLRDLNGNGVLTGLTEISEIQSSKMVDGEKVPCEGKLFYRGVDVEQIVSGFIREKRYGFEETVYLLLFGALPDEAQLDDFKKLLAGYRSLPTNFVRDVILKAPNADMMNTLARSVLTLYSYDARARTTAPRMYCASACSSLRCSPCSRYTVIRRTALCAGQKPVHPQPRARAFHR